MKHQKSNKLAALYTTIVYILGLCGLLWAGGWDFNFNNIQRGPGLVLAIILLGIPSGFVWCFIYSIIFDGDL